MPPAGHEAGSQSRAPVTLCVGGLSGPAQPLLLALLGAGVQAIPPACGAPSVPLVHIQALTQPGARCPAVCTPRPPRRATRRAWTVEPPVDGGCRGLCQDVPRALTSGWGSWGAHHPACPSQGPRVRWCWPHVPPGPAETAVSVGSQRTMRASPVPAPRAGRVSPGGGTKGGSARGQIPLPWLGSNGKQIWLLVGHPNGTLTCFITPKFSQKTQEEVGGVPPFIAGNLRLAECSA